MVTLDFGVKKFHRLLAVGTFSMVVEFLMGLSDVVIAGNLLGADALSGVNLLQSPLNFVSFVACLLATGSVVCFSLETGRFDARRAKEFFSQGFWSAVGSGLAMCAAFLLLRNIFIDGFGAAAEVTTAAKTYWDWFVPNAILEPLAVLLGMAAFADGDGRLSFFAYVVQIVGDIALSFFLCKAMGVAGLALGTTIGNAGAVLLLCCHFWRKSNTLAVVRHFSWRDLWIVVKGAFGDASTRLCWALLFLLLNKYVIDHFGSAQLPVLAAVVAVLGLSEAFNGVPNAAQPLVGVYAGEKNVKGVKSVMRAAGKTAFLEGLGISLLFALWPELMVKLVGVDDPALARATASAVRITSAGLTFSALVFLFNSYYLFIEHEALACVLTLLANLVVPVALYLPLGAVWGESGVWTALGIAPAVTIILFSAAVGWRHGWRRFPLLLAKEREARLHEFSFILKEQAIVEASARVGEIMRAAKCEPRQIVRASLMVEEVLMEVMAHNAGRTVCAEVTLDLNDGVSLVMRDDGEIFDITDSDAKIDSLRAYLVTSIMTVHEAKRNLTTTGFNRNVFRF